MLRAGLIQHVLKINAWSFGLRGWPALTSLAIILCIGICHKIQVAINLALTITSLIRRRVMLLPFGVAALLSLSWHVIIRLGVFGTIRINILNQSRHECPHVIVVAVELSQFLLQGRCWGYNY